MMARRRADAGKHHGATAICVSNSPVASRHSGLLVLARNTKNGLGSSTVGSFGRLVEWIVRVARWPNRSGDSPSRLFGKLAERIVRKARQADCLESSPSGSFEQLAERTFKKLTKRIAGVSYRGALQARRAHLAENAARGPRCEARILGASG